MQYRDINLLYPTQGPLGADAAGYSREIHAPAIKPRHYRQIVVRGIDDVFAIDLAVMHGWRDEWYGKLSENDGMKYMLLVVDVFSKYLWAFPLKGKTSAEVKQAFASIPRQPRAIMADSGKEFMGEFIKWAEQRGIGIYHLYGDHKASPAERCIRTIQALLWRLMTARQVRRWVDLLPIAVKFYNSSIHRTTKMTPIEASDPVNEAALWQHMFGRNLPDIPEPPKQPKFKLGDFVRVSILRNAMEKAYWGSWSLDSYRIVGISFGRPVMYTNLDNSPVIGRFYEEQLQKTVYPFIEIKKETTVMPKPKNFVNIERVLDAKDTLNGQPWLLKNKPMVWLKIKWEGTTDTENNALPLDKLWIPYVDLAFDREGLPNPAIEKLLKSKRLWTKAQDYKVKYLKKK